MVIRRIKGKYYVYSEEGKVLSRAYNTKEEAEERLKEIEIFKRMKQQTDQVDISHLDFEINDDNIIIYNVPIAAELVQQYDDGFAYKPVEQIMNIEVDQVPLTIVNSKPAHPSKYLSDMTTRERADVTVGFMSEPSRPKENKKNKRYADFVIHRTPKTKALEGKLKIGESVDTSIGFNFEQLDNSGTFNGMKYDYIQSNIKLDHNAILIDAVGNKGTGRAPNPIAGIGADSSDKLNTEETKMVNDENKQKIDELTSANVKLTEERTAVDSKVVELTKRNDEFIAKVADLEKNMSSIKAESDSLKLEIGEYRKERQSRIDEARRFISEKYPEMSELFKGCDEKALLTQYDSLIKVSSKTQHTIGADMMGTSKNRVDVDKALSNYSKDLNSRIGKA